MFRVNDYKTEITETHKRLLLYYYIISDFKKRKIGKRRKEEKERGEELKIQQKANPKHGLVVHKDHL